MSNYQKYKERSPEETIYEIQGILRRIGVYPVLKWTGECRKGFYSNRITLYPTNAGTNGKGTDELYSTASGYGELMERLQNNMLLERPLNSEQYRELGFSEAPDESVIPLEDLLENPDPFTKALFEALSNENEASNGQALCRLYSYEKDGRLVLDSVPFADPANNRVIQMPIYVVRRFTGSNGMAAGNTMEEALVQGLSELFEREVMYRVLGGEAVPPKIPDSALEPYDFYERIRELHESGLKVRVLDCSLGKGWPVIATCIHNPKTGHFGIDFGAHPSFPVAVERTLTEAAQGKKLYRFAENCRSGSLENSSCNANRLNVSGIGCGVFPESMFYKKPDWEYRPWTRFRGNGNPAFLREMISLLKEEGLTPLVRDTSFLGFPACYIVIPGFHPIHYINGTNVRLKRTVSRASTSFKHFPELTEAEVKRIQTLLRHWEHAFDKFLMSQLKGTAPGSQYSNERIGAFLSLSIEDYAEAEHYFETLARMEGKKEEQEYYSAMKEFCRMKKEGRDNQEIYTFMKRLRNEKTAERVQEDTGDYHALLLKELPPLKCPDCAVCPLREKGCQHPAHENLYIRIASHMKKENASQEELLKLLQPIYEAV